MSRARLVAVAAAVVAGLFSVTPAAARMPSPTTESQMDAALSAEQELARDAAELAPTVGQSDAQMLQRMKDEQAAGVLIETIRTLARERFGGAWADVSGLWVVHVRLTVGAPLSDVDRLVADSKLPVLLEYGGSLSEQDLADAATAVAAGFTRTDKGIDGVYVDIAAAELVAVANPDASPTTLRDLDHALVNPATGELALSSPTRAGNETEQSAAGGVSIRTETSPGRAASTNRGGVAMSSCTSGFTVRGSSATGILTAGHCGDPQSYATTPGGTPSYTAPFITQSWTSNSDLQWHTTPSHTDYASFYGSSSSTPTARTGTGVAYSGQGLCHRGKTSGYSCGYVTSTAFAPTWSGACGSSSCTASFVRVDGVALANLGGDSGGPWFSGGYAYGIHMGGLIGEVAAWAVYTPISRISNMNVSLL